VRRTILALFALVALGAAAPAADVPTVVVFPLQASAALDRDVNLRIVTQLANEIAVDGRVRIAAADPDIQRPDYLTAARKAGAQFYVTGFITPLGDGASIIEQVVSTTSGTIVFSNSGQITSLADVNAQGDILRAGILDRAQRATYSFTAPSGGGPAAAPTPARENATDAPEANIGGLFHHKKAAPKPSPSPSPSPSPAASPAPHG
jgi:hypothetical protein